MRIVLNGQECVFGKCLKDLLNSNGDDGTADASVRWELKENEELHLTTAPDSDNSDDFVPFWHASDCHGALPCPLTLPGAEQTPSEVASSRPHKRANINKKKVKVGVCVVVRDEHDRVLLTRRSSKLSLFPGVWVLPGGHREPGESMAEAGVRELAEECGVTVPATSLRPLAAYESAFPPAVDQQCQPATKAHHVVLFYEALLPDSSLDAGAETLWSRRLEQASHAHEIDAVASLTVDSPAAVALATHAGTGADLHVRVFDAVSAKYTQPRPFGHLALGSRLILRHLQEKNGSK